MWLKLNQSVSQTNKKNLHSGLNLMHWVPGCKENPILSPLVSDDFLSSFPPVRSYVPPWCLAPLSPFLPSLSGLSLHAPCFQCQLVFVFWKVPVQSWLHQPVCKQNNIFFWKKKPIRVGSAFLEETFTSTYADASRHLALRRCAETSCLPLDPPSILNMVAGWSIWSREKILAFLLFHLRP